MDPPPKVLLKPTRSLSKDSGFTAVSDTEDDKVTGIAVGVVLLLEMGIPEGAVVGSEVRRGASGLEDSAPGEVESEREAKESTECCVL